MALGDFNQKSLACVEPGEESGEARFSVDCQQRKISVEGCQNVSFFCSFQIHSSGSQMKSSTFYSPSQILLIHTKSHRQHFSHRQTPIFHATAPLLHNSAPFLKILRDDISIISNFPVEPPFGVSAWIGRSNSFMRILQSSFIFRVTLKFFLHRMHDSYLVVTLGRNVDSGHTFIELFASDCEVFF